MPDYVKQLTEAGITSTSDGLLKDFIARGNYAGALLAITNAIEKREREIDFLRDLDMELLEVTTIEEETNE